MSLQWSYVCSRGVRGTFGGRGARWREASAAWSLPAALPENTGGGWGATATDGPICSQAQDLQMNLDSFVTTAGQASADESSGSVYEAKSVFITAQHQRDAFTINQAKAWLQIQLISQR